jgi:hypothetical protein
MTDQIDLDALKRMADVLRMVCLCRFEAMAMLANSGTIPSQSMQDRNTHSLAALKNIDDAMTNLKLAGYQVGFETILADMAEKESEK